MIEKLRQSLINETFTTSAYKEKIITKPKKRTIYKLPYYPDRIVQHALMNVLSPILEKKFIENTYSCIKGRGQLRASQKCDKFVKTNSYCFKGDIKKFYPNIDHDILMSQLEHIIKDKRVLNLLRNIVYSIPGGKNVPIGNLTSQWLGNLYLTALDLFVYHKLKCSEYVRYCDDFILFSNDKTYLTFCKNEIEEFIGNELKLEYSKAEAPYVAKPGSAVHGCQ